MVLRVMAVDAEQACRQAAARLTEHGLPVEPGNLEAREIQANTGLLGWWFRREREFQVTVKEEVLAAHPKVRLFRVAQAVGADRPGSAVVRVDDRGILVRVFPPVGQGRPRVRVEDVMRRLQAKGIQDIDEKALNEAVEKADGTWVKVAERRPELDRDAEIIVEVASDRMSATITLRPPLGGKAADLAALRQALAEHGIVYGIDEEALASLARQPVYGQAVTVARGQEAVRGRDGFFEPAVSGPSLAPMLRDDGTVDYREVSLAHVVKPGDPVGKLHPPEEGTPGRNIFGEVIPAEAGAPSPVTLGAGVRLDEGTGTVYAEVEGRVVLGSSVSVEQIWEIDGDVDYSVGNVRFPGTVIVRGNVREGFLVEAGGSVIVKGSIEAATVISKEGDIQVSQGIRGVDQKGRVEAPKGVVRAKFVENAVVRARALEVRDAIFYSQISVAESIRVSDREGRIAGGRLEAFTLIEAAYLGSPHATRTELVLRSPEADSGESPGHPGAIQARRLCYPNTIIRIGGFTYPVEIELKRPRFRLGEDRIEVGAA